MTTNFGDKVGAQKQEIIRYIKAKTGAKSLIMILSESKIPCECAKEDADKCTGHYSGCIIDGMDAENIVSVLEQTLEKIKKNFSI